MNECERICELLLDYINRRLTQDKKTIVVKHIAECQYCRSELAALIRIRNLAQAKIPTIPQNIIDSAFDKIPDNKRTLGTILNLGQYFKVFDSLSVTMSIVKQIMQLAQQAI